MKFLVVLASGPSRAGQNHHSLDDEVGVLDQFGEAHPEFPIAVATPTSVRSEAAVTKMILIVIIADTPSGPSHFALVAPAKDRSIGFESPQLHQEIRANRPRFLGSKFAAEISLFATFRAVAPLSVGGATRKRSLRWAAAPSRTSCVSVSLMDMDAPFASSIGA